jgi:hypothetical protein
MSDVLTRIKRTVLSGRYVFTRKARIEMAGDDITELDVIESISNAGVIYKTLRSTSPRRETRGEKLYVIQSTSFAGLFIYTKGKLAPGPDGRETFYFLISAKRSVSE